MLRASVEDVVGIDVWIVMTRNLHHHTSASSDGMLRAFSTSSWKKKKLHFDKIINFTHVTTE